MLDGKVRIFGSSFRPGLPSSCSSSRVRARVRSSYTKAECGRGFNGRPLYLSAGSKENAARLSFQPTRTVQSNYLTPCYTSYYFQYAELFPDPGETGHGL